MVEVIGVVLRVLLETMWLGLMYLSATSSVQERHNGERRWILSALIAPLCLGVVLTDVLNQDTLQRAFLVPASLLMFISGITGMLKFQREHRKMKRDMQRHHDEFLKTLAEYEERNRREGESQ